MGTRKAGLVGRSGSQAQQGSHEPGPLGGVSCFQGQRQKAVPEQRTVRGDMRRAGPTLLAGQAGGYLAPSPKAAFLFGSICL